MSSPEMEIKAGQLAQALGFSVERLSQLVKSNVITKNDRRRYTVKCITDYCAWIRADAMGRKTESLVGDSSVERARLLKAQADHKEIEVDELKGNVIPAEIVQDAWTALVSNSKMKLLGIPSKLSHRLIACDTFDEAEELLTEHIESALSELANDGIPESYRTRTRADS